MKTNRRRILVLLLALAMVFSFAACSAAEESADEEGPAEIQGKIILATTTSTKDSGLLDFILPEFTYNTGWEVDVIASGRGAVITMADEKFAYTVTDRSTWLNVGADTDLQIVCEKDPSGIFNNQYGVICLNPETNKNINAVGAKDFQNWILSTETQELIGTYGTEEFGAPLFTPNAK